MSGRPRVAFCDLRVAHEFRGAATEAALLRVARSGRYVLGPETEAFEREFAVCCGAAHSVGVGSGTDALTLILRASDIGPGDEVVVPAYTAAATWMAVVAAGARPVGADVDPDTGLVVPEAVRAAVGPRTAALVGVHLFGRLAPISELQRIAEPHGLLVIEDAAHAAGIDEGEGPAGSLAGAAAFSFYPTKPLGALGDGGAVVTDDPRLAAEVRRLRSYGWSQWQGQAERPGVNSRLDELQAAVLRDRLAQLPRAHARLRALAGVYRSALAGRDELGLPAVVGTGEPPWHQFVVTYGRRDALRAALAEAGVGAAVHYDPIPPGLQAFAGSGEFPQAAELASRALSLPFDAWLTGNDLSYVCEALTDALESWTNGSAALSRT